MHNAFWGRYKQWNGLLEWNTGLDYWNGIFLFSNLYFPLTVCDIRYCGAWIMYRLVGIYCELLIMRISQSGVDWQT